MVLDVLAFFKVADPTADTDSSTAALPGITPRRYARPDCTATRASDFD